MPSDNKSNSKSTAADNKSSTKTTTTENKSGSKTTTADNKSGSKTTVADNKTSGKTTTMVNKNKTTTADKYVLYYATLIVINNLNWLLYFINVIGIPPYGTIIIHLLYIILQ